MSSIYLDTGSISIPIIIDLSTPISGQRLLREISSRLGSINTDSFFLKNNGQLVGADSTVHQGDVVLLPKLCGGKGGFGSMLRAIGAQIEKTTNREACRDLSGRRLRDINEEKRMKAWIEKQPERDEEAAERKKRKLTKLRAEPRHEFKDRSYEQQRSELTERVEDAVEVGFTVAAAAASTSGVKRAVEEKQKPKKKRKTILDDDELDSDDLDSSSDEESETSKKGGEVCKTAGESSGEESETSKKDGKVCKTAGEFSGKSSSDSESSSKEGSSAEGKPKSVSASPKSSDDTSR